MGVAAAVAGAAVVGAVASRNSTKAAINASEKAGQKSSQQLAASTAQARGDLFKLFPAAQENSQRGYQGALDVFKQALPQQANTFQAGNVAAQNQLLAGMPQYQNAILGAPVDYSQFQATQLEQPSFDFANQQLQYTDPYAPAPQQQGAFSDNNSIGPYPTGNDPRYSAGQPTDRAFNYNDLLTRGFR
tara:strand:+ start:603 stop:1166 length:564 start_codon:yes stop_codon:yes gene_type:complete